MGILKIPHRFLSLLLLLTTFLQIQCAVQDLSPAIDERPSLYRKAREDRYYFNRYGSAQDRNGGNVADRGLDRNRRPALKHDGSHPEARDGDSTTGAGLEKRCIRCTTSYLDPYDYRDYYDRDRYYYDRYDGRGYDDRYDDRYYQRYDNRNGYDRSYYDRDRWYDRPYERPNDYRNYDRYYDRYDRPYDRSYDRYDRGFGYDNRGYDYRRMHDGRGLRPWEDTARGSSGWDYYGRGYYRSDPGTNWGYDRGYASGYNYGGGRGDSWRDYRRDPYDPYGYRGTSYLYERNGGQTPITTTRPPPSKNGEPGATDRPDSNPNKSPDNSGSG